MDVPPDPARCPNCATSVDGARYCPRCGQQQGILVPSLGSWLKQALEETLFVEGRLPATLARLFWPPGELTAEWRRGRRASYVHPLRVYLLAAAVFFVPWTLTSGSGLLVGFVVQASMQEAGVLPDYAEASYEPLQPLTPGEAQDSTARARWRATFEAQRAEARSRAADENARIRAGVQRVADLLPLLVGALLVPVLAGASWLLTTPKPWEGRGRRSAPEEPRSPRYMEHVVLSTHVHAVGYVVLGALVLLAAPAGPEVSLLLWPLGFAAVTLYFLAALRRNFRAGPALLLTALIAVPPLYVVAFWTLSRSAIQLLVRTGLIT